MIISLTLSSATAKIKNNNSLLFRHPQVSGKKHFKIDEEDILILHNIQNISFHFIFFL